MTAQTASDTEVAHARAEADRLPTDLEDWRRLAEAGEVTAISFARAEKGLLVEIAKHEAGAAERAFGRCCAAGRCARGSGVGRAR